MSTGQERNGTMTGQSNGISLDAKTAEQVVTLLRNAHGYVQRSSSDGERSLHAAKITYPYACGAAEQALATALVILGVEECP